MPKWLQWRRWLWIYRGAGGGWCVFVLERGYYVEAITRNDRGVLLDSTQDPDLRERTELQDILITLAIVAAIIAFGAFVNYGLALAGEPRALWLMRDIFGVI